MRSAPVGRQRVHRVNVNFSHSAYVTLVELAARKDKSLSETLRDAIALEKWFQDTIEAGGRVLVETSNGHVREVIPR